MTYYLTFTCDEDIREQLPEIFNGFSASGDEYTFTFHSHDDLSEAKRYLDQEGIEIISEFELDVDDMFSEVTVVGYKTIWHTKCQNCSGQSFPVWVPQENYPDLEPCELCGKSDWKGDAEERDVPILDSDIDINRN